MLNYRNMPGPGDIWMSELDQIDADREALDEVYENFWEHWLPEKYPQVSDESDRWGIDEEESFFILPYWKEFLENELERFSFHAQEVFGNELKRLKQKNNLKNER